MCLIVFSLAHSHSLNISHHLYYICISLTPLQILSCLKVHISKRKVRTNVFVVGLESKNILVIVTGKATKREIETTYYGLPKPRTIFFDKIRKQLLVTNEDSFVHLYNITHS